MGNGEKILINKKILENIKTGLNAIKLMSNEKNTKKEIERLMNILNEELQISILSIEEKILKKMKETKRSDPEMNANLYILHRKLVNKQITEQQAAELYDMYVKIEPYETKIF